MILTPTTSPSQTSSNSCSPSKAFRKTIKLTEDFAHSFWLTRKISPTKRLKSNANSVNHTESWSSQRQVWTKKIQFSFSWLVMEQALLHSFPCWTKSRIRNGMMLTQSPWSMESETQTSLFCSKIWCSNSLMVSLNTSLFWLSLEVKTLLWNKTKPWTLFLNATKVTFNKF